MFVNPVLASSFDFTSLSRKGWYENARRERSKSLQVCIWKEDKGSFLPQNLLVETQVLALPAGAPDEREQGSGGVKQAWPHPQNVPKGRSELSSEREGGQAIGEAVVMQSYTSPHPSYFEYLGS